MVFRNSFWNVGSYFIGLLVLAVATPVYINLLGLEQFGIFILLATATAPLGILNAGVGQAVTKYVAEFKSAGEPERAIRLVATTLCLNLGVGVAGFTALCLIADWVVQRVFKIPAELAAEARISICLAGGVWLFTVISGTFQAVIVGLQNFRLIAIGNALQQTLTYGAGIGVLYLSPRISSLLWWNLGVAAVIMLFWCSRAKTEFGGLRLLPKWDSESAGLSWRFSMWQILNSLLAIPVNHVDRFLLVTMIGPAAVGIYGVALSVQSRVVGLVWSAVGTLFPAASAQLRNEGASERFILITGSMMSLLAGGGYAILCVLGPDLLCLWLGESVGRQSGPLLQVLMLAAILGLPSAVIYQYLMATGRTRISTLSNVATVAVTVGASFFWIREAGLRGAAWGGLLGLALTRPLFHRWVFRQYFQGIATTTECFCLLYLNLASVLSGLILGFALHRWLLGALGLRPGTLVSLVATPVLIYAVILVMEATIMRRRAMVLQLCSEVWRKIGRRRAQP